MRYVLEESAMWTAIFGGVAFTLVVAGVTLHIDRQMESYFIQIDPTLAERPAIQAIVKLASALGYEVMPEWECPPQDMKNGAIRHWMAEMEVVDDRSPVQTV